mmetsp:Transcript_9895/g.24487  ORF Transcript_9895/g.24487 Transcript_9895/m.24487 type:complete len:230 (-) Transcript_9895:167-856(-)
MAMAHQASTASEELATGIVAQQKDSHLTLPEDAFSPRRGRARRNPLPHPPPLRALAQLEFLLPIVVDDDESAPVLLLLPLRVQVGNLEQRTYRRRFCGTKSSDLCWATRFLLQVKHVSLPAPPTEETELVLVPRRASRAKSLPRLHQIDTFLPARPAPRSRPFPLPGAAPRRRRSPSALLGRSEGKPCFRRRWVTTTTWRAVGVRAAQFAPPRSPRPCSKTTRNCFGCR